MKILVDCSLLRIGGGLQVGLSTLHAAAGTRQHAWYAFVSRELASQVPPAIWDGFLDHWVTISAFGRAAIGFQLLSVERAVRPDVVYTVFGPPYVRCRSVNICGFAIPRMIYPWRRYRYESLRENLYARAVGAAKRLLINNVDSLVVETPLVKELAIERFGIQRERVFVSPNTYSPTFVAMTRHATTKPHRPPFQILVPSSYYVHKNLEFVPYVAAALAPRFQQSCRFLFTLDPTSKPWRRIVGLANRLAVGENMATVGNMDHAGMARLYLTSSAVFLPTLLECSTAVYPEAFFAGVPVVTSDLDFARRLCGEAAVYIDPANPECAARAIASVLADKSLRDKLVSEGRTALDHNYPTPERKWKDLMTILSTAAYLGKRLQTSVA